ncbi:MAG TPA: fumarylacetoacetase [Flavobacteriales bacterium]|nr:fumarylacetoacetase [Flavobacteriales bacterium]HQW31119.1 fumarylacetoacetase [Flavobacteriales bacterium]HQY02165.1 fumarylacetoacetase [Flavobacteriales bacterium]HQY78236.1 fumarylacetoacetase [Flavobacteriales bacterium]HRA15887.1 fumarylacetoacetase [Flavobacteriales bacterium]
MTSWVHVPADSDFPIQNIPFGICSSSGRPARPCTRIGNHVIDLQALAQADLLNDLGIETAVFDAPVLNPLMKHGKPAVRQLRRHLMELFRADNGFLKERTDTVNEAVLPMTEVTMHLPVEVGDYTDFYSSREHATNVGTMFRSADNALMPNWLHLPVGYHGRASSIVVSGTDIQRPKGQMRPKPDEPPVFGPTNQLDIELETAFITFEGRPLGEHIEADEAEDFIFGMVLFNDWSARDIQSWEYVPLGPFLGKNFGSSMSPWVVTLDALEPFRTATPKQDPMPLPYLRTSGEHSFDIALEASIIPNNGEETVICRSNFKYLYWSMPQQLAHHTVNGCNVRAGDVMASGTISGPVPESYGSLLELTWRGTKPLTLKDGSDRKFLEDGDTVVIRGHGERDGVRIGFGEVRGEILPAG